jgi:hypothetical protein
MLSDDLLTHYPYLLITDNTIGNFGQPPTLNKADHIFVYIASGTPTQKWSVMLEIEEDVELHPACAASIGVALAGQHFTLSSPVLDELLVVMPETVVPISWVSTYESWLF